MELKELFTAIRTIRTVAEKAKKEEADDNIYVLLSKLNDTAQKVLWHLTHGEDGIQDGYDLIVVGNKPQSAYDEVCQNTECDSYAADDEDCFADCDKFSLAQAFKCPDFIPMNFYEKEQRRGNPVELKTEEPSRCSCGGLLKKAVMCKLCYEADFK